MSVVASFLDAVGRTDRTEALEVIRTAAEELRTPARLVDDVFAPIQREVGRRWEVGAWTVAQEHLATEYLLDATSFLLDHEPTDPRGRVLVVNAEGEWHSLTAHLAAIALRHEGYSVSVLGGSVPAGHILPMIHETGPRVVALTCSLPANLPGARRVTAVAREAGVPVLVGGSAIDPVRAAHVGASAWAPTMSAAAEALEMLPDFVPPIDPLTHPRASEYAWLTDHLGAVNAEVANRLAFHEDAHLDVTEVGWALRTLQASLMCDEDELWSEHLEWMRRRADAPDVDLMLSILRDWVPQDQFETQRLLAV